MDTADELVRGAASQLAVELLAEGEQRLVSVRRATPREGVEFSQPSRHGGKLIKAGHQLGQTLLVRGPAEEPMEQRLDLGALHLLPLFEVV